MEDAKTILARWAEMESARLPWDSAWQMASDYALPRKGNIARTESAPGSNAGNRLYDTTAIQAVTTLANGHASYITPPGTRWFAWEAPEDIKGDRADAWYNEASEKAAKILSTTNFYTTLNEAFLDRSAFGVCCIAAMPSADRIVSFQAHPVGSYCIDEDAEANVDTIFLKKRHGIRQLVQLFGEEAVRANERLAKSWERFKDKGTNAEHEVVHAVFPRVERQRGKHDVFNMRYASVWVSADGKTVLQRSGVPELPYCVSRYLKRSGSGMYYGYSPFEEVKAAVLEANKTRQILQVVGQRLAVPSVLIPDNLVGNVDSRPGGRTVFKSSGQGALPQEWLNRGRPEGMHEQLADARETINAAFHVDLFRMFAQIDKQMTAREVSERAAEKLMQFSPAFTRFTADFQVMMERVFAILFRAGVFGRMDEIPREVIRRTSEGAEVPAPKVIYQSRIALAIRQAESAAADRLVERVLGVANAAPDTLDNLNLDEYVRVAARNDGVPEAVIRPVKERDALREDRAKAQQQQAMAQMAMQAPQGGGQAIPAI
jgi:hypothetical protein